jgi:membrane protease subunit (stomatin/prohibitin family)
MLAYDQEASMTLRDLIQGELIDIVEWLETNPDMVAWRFIRPNNEIKNGARLIVRPGQLAVFVEQGSVADVFQPGSHELTTSNLPVLSKLRGWKYGFQSPFKAEVVFVSTRQFTSNKWGTKTPVMMRDPELGAVRLRVYGTYTMRVTDAESFVRELVGANSSFTIAQITDQLRDLIVARFSELLGEQAIPVLQLASNYRELGDRAAIQLQPELARFGVDLTQLVVESIALPDEVAATLDQHTRIALIGDVGAYAQLQAADAIRDAARNPGGGGASAGAGIGVGIAMAQQLAGTASQAMRPAAPASGATPPPIPPGLAFFVAENGKPVGPFDHAALAERTRAGKLRADTLVWREGMAAWAVASQVPELGDVLKVV